jgi:hypothetical protein
MTDISEHRYGIGERQRQLAELVASLRALIPVVAETPQVSHLTIAYEQAMAQATALLHAGFRQEELSALSRSVPDIVSRHKDWMPPLEQEKDGSWREAPWFTNIEPLLQPVLKAAGLLRVLGYY